MSEVGDLQAMSWPTMLVLWWFYRINREETLEELQRDLEITHPGLFDKEALVTSMDWLAARGYGRWVGSQPEVGRKFTTTRPGEKAARVLIEHIITFIEGPDSKLSRMMFASMAQAPDRDDAGGDEGAGDD